MLIFHLVGLLAPRKAPNLEDLGSVLTGPSLGDQSNMVTAQTPAGIALGIISPSQASPPLEIRQNTERSANLKL